MIEWYSSIPIFTGLSKGALALLTSRAEILELPAQHTVFSQGEPGYAIYLIEEGEVEVFQTDFEGNEIHLADLPKGDFFGEMAMLECTPHRTESVRTCEPSCLHVMTNGDMLRLYKAMPEQYSILILNIARDLSRRLHQSNNKLCSLIAGNSNPLMAHVV